MWLDVIGHSMVGFITRGGGGELPNETDGNARRLAWDTNFGCLVLLRVFGAKRQRFKPRRSRLG